MKKVFQISAILLIFSLLIACNKDPEITVYSGRVLERVSNKPIVNAKIEVKTCKGDYDTGQLSCYTVDTIFSDKDGNFSYPITGAEWSTKLDFFAEKQHYYKDDGTNFNGTGLVKKDIFLDAKAWLDLRMVREAPFDEYCISVLGPNSPKFTLNGCKGSSFYYQYEGIYQELGNDTLKIRWEVYYFDKTTTDVFWKSIYLKGLDTTTFELKF
jgi:hypothetical protein